VRTIAGLLICGLAVVAFDNGIYHLVRTGSCGSDGTYVSTRPCPPGTGAHILSLIGGVFGGLIGVAVYATRGGGATGGTSGRRSAVGLPVIMWSLLFVTIALSVGVAAFGPASNDNAGSRTVAIVLGAIFIPMGLAPLPLAFGGRKKRARIQSLAQSGKRCSGVVTSVEDTGMTINDNPRVKITVRAEPAGEPQFTIEKTATVSRVAIPRAGDRVVVFYDPANRLGNNGISFDQVPGFTHPVAAPVPVSAPADDDEDPLDRIAKLGELRDRGLITPEEFEAKKKELLKEL
jgi:hypothetical protein